MLHLTYTGANAGRILCGLEKAESVKDGNAHLHAIYFDLDNFDGDPRRIPNPGYASHEVCLACLEEMRTALA